MILIPAYGRDYQTAAEVRKDWEAGKDFRIADVSSRWNGAYTSIRDTVGHPDAADNKHAWSTEGSYIRYKRHAELTFIGKWEEADADKRAAELAETNPDLVLPN